MSPRLLSSKAAPTSALPKAGTQEIHADAPALPEPKTSSAVGEDGKPVILDKLPAFRGMSFISCLPVLF